MPKRAHSPAADNCRRRLRLPQRQGIKGRMPSLRLNFIHYETSYPERAFLSAPRTNCSAPWERNPKVILVYLLSSLRSIIRQLSLLRTLSSHTLSSKRPTATLSVDLHLHHREQVYKIPHLLASSDLSVRRIGRAFPRKVIPILFLPVSPLQLAFSLYNRRHTSPQRTLRPMPGTLGGTLSRYIPILRTLGSPKFSRASGILGKPWSCARSPNGGSLQTGFPRTPQIVRI